MHCLLVGMASLCCLVLGSVPLTYTTDANTQGDDDSLLYPTSGGVVLQAWTDTTGAHTHAANFSFSSETGRVRWGTQQPAMEPHTRGLHMMVLHPHTARVVARRVFLTEEPYTWWADLVWWLGRVVPGRLVVLATGDMASLGLRHARLLFQHLGSVFIPFLGYNTSWSWAFIKGGITLYETMARGPHIGQDIGLELCSSSVFAEGLVRLMHGHHQPIKSTLDQKRWHYCAAHGAMGGLCDEHDPDPLPPPQPAPVTRQAALADVPIIVTAGARHQYLYHTLTTLLAAPGALHQNVLVVLGDAPPSTTSLLHLLGINFTTVAVSGRDNDKLFRYYRAVFSLLEQSFPDAPAAILLDEDVEVSPDFFSFFSQTLWLLHADPSLYCINAFSYLPKLERGRGEQFVRRGAVQVMWGYAVTLNFVREAVRQWPFTAQHEDILTYDYWLYDKVRGERECVFPEISRVRHYGVGTNTSPFPHEYEAWYRPLLYASHVPLLNTPLVLQKSHETHFLSDLQAALPVTAGNPCNSNFELVASTSRRPLVVYFVQEEQEDITSWYELAQCTGLHSVSEQGHHAGVQLAFYPRQPFPDPHPQHPLNTYGFNYHTPSHIGAGEANYTRVYLVGVPYSRYSLRSNRTQLFDARQLSYDQIVALRSRFSDSYSILLYNVTTHNYYTLIQQLFTQSSHYPLK